MRLLINGPPSRRRGVILIVVLAMLTLFAIVGVTFVLVADSQATSARIALEGEINQGANSTVSPTYAFNLFMSQLLYDLPDDLTGVYSAMRGQSLARNAYGWNPGTLNDKPFNGTGRLHFTPTAFLTTDVASDDAFLMNYQYFAADGFLRDPERPDKRPNLAAPQKPYLGGFNVPYTYPDHNHFYLAEIDPSTGMVIVPSFHRSYLFGALNNPANPNWTNTQGKYLTLRPRPADHSGFPMPGDGSGDVKNLVGTLGGNDSLWLDFGFPVMQLTDGRKYKALVAPLILALDGRLDVNTLGNIMGGGNAHRSNQGWGAWEANLGQVLNGNAAELASLFTGSAQMNAQGFHRYRGRYDQGTNPASPSGPAITGTNKTRGWGPVDYNGMTDGTGAASSPYTLPAASSSSSYYGFPTFPAATYGNGGAAENTNHASIFNSLRPRGLNRRFSINSAAELLRYNVTSPPLASDFARLLPTNLAPSPDTPQAFKRRNLLTHLSADLERPGATPYIWNPRDGSTPPQRFQVTPTGNIYRPLNQQPIPFPAVSPPPSVPAPSANNLTTSEFDPTLRSTLAAMMRLDLNRPLTPYPVPNNTGAMPQNAQLTQAVKDRQNFAKDIFAVLMKVTGAIDPVTAYAAPYGPNSPEYRGARYLAQLAVNLVDQIDSDDIITPFMWSNASGTNEYVFGVELPRLVVNETYVQYDNEAGSIIGVAPNQTVDPTKNYNVNVWVELHNPMKDDNAISGYTDTTARLSTGASGANLAYRILLADPNLNNGPMAVLCDPANTTGDPDFGTPGGTLPETPASRIRSRMTAWGNPASDLQTVLPGGGAFNDTTKKNVGFYVIGPDTTANPFDNALDNPNLTVTTSAAKMTYKIPATPVPTTVPRPTIILQRLANPGLPINTTLTDPLYNPYITVDFAENTTAQVMDSRRFDNTMTARTPTLTAARTSVGRSQPYAAALAQRIIQNPATPQAMQPRHTFFQQNCNAANAAALNAAASDTTLKLPFDWLTQLDRYATNPLELLQVSDARPHDLTQRFVTAAGMAAPAQQHIAPWTTESARLYRFFEFVMSSTRGTGNMPGPGGRVMGKVNINGFWNQEILNALADPQGGNSFNQGHVNTLFTNLMAQRNPGSVVTGAAPNQAVTPVIGPTDQTLATLSGQTLQRPFWSLALGTAANGDPFLQQAAGSSRGMQNTIFQAPGGTPLFDVPGVTHPYQQKELLRKMAGNLTTRSNVFGVWATVGYFQVMDDTTLPVKLGGELLINGTTTRHRMFSIVDRTQLQAWPTYIPNQPTTPTVKSTGVSITVTDTSAGESKPVTLSSTSVTHPLAATTPAYTWTLQPGAVLVYEPNTDNEETVVVQGPAGGPYTAVFRKNHGVNVPVTARANPGPLKNYDPAKDPDVVPYYAILD